MKHLPITIIMLVNRNDDNLRKALRSVSFADEIIIIDNKSGVAWREFDELPLVIKSIPEPLLDFSVVRNNAISLAKHDWIFFVDSDEEVVHPVVPQLAAILANQTAKGAVVYRSDVFYGRKLLYGEAGHQPLVRIGKKPNFKFTGKIHEVAVIEGELLYPRIELIHHAHPSINEFVNDVSQYAQIVAKTKTSNFIQNLAEMILFPPIKLLYALIIQGGIMDGWRGLVYASCMSLHSLLVRIYRYEDMATTKKNTSR